MPKFLKISALMTIDFVLCALSIILAYFVRFENIYIFENIDYLNIVIPSLAFVIILVFLLGRNYTITKFALLKHLILMRAGSIYDINIKNSSVWR